MEVFGKEQLTGVLVVDRYAGYNRVPCEIQYCYAHLLREMKDLEAEFETNQEVKNYTLGDEIATDGCHAVEKTRVKGVGISETSRRNQVENS